MITLTRTDIAAWCERAGGIIRDAHHAAQATIALAIIDTLHELVRPDPAAEQDAALADGALPAGWLPHAAGPSPAPTPPAEARPPAGLADNVVWTNVRPPPYVPIETRAPGAEPSGLDTAPAPASPAVRTPAATPPAGPERQAAPTHARRGPPSAQTAERDALLLQIWPDLALKVREVAERLNALPGPPVGETVCYQWATRLGMKGPRHLLPNARKLPYAPPPDAETLAEDKREAFAMFAAGRTGPDIAEHFGITRELAATWRQEWRNATPEEAA
jgi:hypothetical protein